MKKRWLIIGLPKSGKTFVADILEEKNSTSWSNQEIRYRDRTIEVPGSFLENHWMHSIIITVAQNQGEGIILIMDGKTLESHYSPAFAQTFNIPCIGVITKSENLGQKEVNNAIKKLTDAGVSEVVLLNEHDSTTYEVLKDLIKKKISEKGGEVDEVHN